MVMSFWLVLFIMEIIVYITLYWFLIQTFYSAWKKATINNRLPQN